MLRDAAGQMLELKCEFRGGYRKTPHDGVPNEPVRVQLDELRSQTYAIILINNAACMHLRFS